MKALGFFEPVRIAVILAFAIGMGIAFHQVFFLAALAFAVTAVVHAIGEHIHRVRPMHRHL